MAKLPYRVILGGIHRDARGVTQHANTFDFETVDRFYTIIPAVTGEVRGWVGHLRDWKWFFPVKGRFDLGIVQPTDWDSPAKGECVFSVGLDASKPQVIEVQPGGYTASRALDTDSILLVFSSGKIEQASTDNYRLPPDYWFLPFGGEEIDSVSHK